MKLRLSATLFAWFATIGLASAQQPCLIEEVAPVPSGPRFYAGAEYLFWWVEGAPSPFPLVTTGPRAAIEDGVLNSANTTILYGGEAQDFGPFSGLRTTIGLWLDEAATFGFEASGFLLERQVAGFSARSDASGSPVLSVPFNNVEPTFPFGLAVGENTLPAALPGLHAGGVAISNSLRLWGADAQGMLALASGANFRIVALSGFRYLDLYESFDLLLDVHGVGAQFLGQAGVTSDHFQTRNQFYGGTFGLRANLLQGPVSLEVMGRVGLGTTHQVLNVGGQYTAVNFRAAGGPLGIFAQPSNSGNATRDVFGVVPEMQVKLGFSVFRCLRATIGYDFVYWNDVVRPGDQLDRNIPKGQTFQQGGFDISATTPARRFVQDDFFAHGLNFGLEFRY